MSNLTYQDFLKRVGEKKYQPIYERKMLRRGLRNLSALEREQQRKNIEEKFKAVNRTANANAKEAIRTARTASNEAHKANMNAIKAWAAYATNPANGNPFNPTKYKEFRKYYISELNRLALGRGDEWKSRGVRFSEFFRRQKAKAQNFRKRSAENLRRAKEAAENAKRAASKAARLKALGTKQLFNNPRARLSAFKYRKTVDAATERARVEGKIRNLKAQAETLRQKSKVLTSLGNANGAAAANAEAAVAAEAAAAAVAQLGTTLRAASAFAKPLLRSRPLGNTGENTNNEEYFNALENFNYALLNTANTNARTLLNIVKNKKTTTQSQRDQAKQKLLDNHPTLIFLENKLARKKTRAGELIAHASTKI
jgi:hypothetical protein